MLHSHYSTFQVPFLPPICLAHELPNTFPWLGLCEVDARRLLLKSCTAPGPLGWRSEIPRACLGVQQPQQVCFPGTSAAVSLAGLEIFRLRDILSAQGMCVLSNFEKCIYVTLFFIVCWMWFILILFSFFFFLL